MKKRMFCLVLVLSLCLGLGVPAFAKSPSVESDIQIQDEIDTLVNAKIESVKDQFDGLPDSYLRVYREYVEAQVEFEVLEKYGINDAISPYSTNATYTYHFYNGGVATYITRDELSGDIFEVSVTCLDRQRTLDYILENSSKPFSVSSIIKQALGFLPYVGGALSNVFYIESQVTESIIAKIADADGYTEILNIVPRIPGIDEPMGTSAVSGWTNHPRCTLPSHAEQPDAKFFPEYVGKE